MKENLTSKNLTNVMTMQMKIGGESDELSFLGDSKNLVDLPFYCFEDDNVESEDDLDFDNLKKCKDLVNKKDHKFVVVFYGEIHNGVETNMRGGKFEYWYENKPQFESTFTLKDQTVMKNSGQIIKVFNKDFSPTKINTAA